MKNYILIILSVLLSMVSSAQNYQTVEELDYSCSQLGFKSNEDAEIAVDEILSQIGLSRNFIILECPDINNAIAKNIRDGQGGYNRYILYDNNFFESMNEKANTDFASLFVLAHEIGHHLSGHSLYNKGSNHEWELEADEFSGFILSKMGVTLEDTQSALRELKYEKATSTHPAKKDRLEAAKNGWDKAKGDNVEEKYKEEKKFSFVLVEKMATYPGCEGDPDLKSCLSKNVGQFISQNYDSSLPGKLGMPEGVVRIFFSFTINKYGFISGVKARAPNPTLHQEAIRVIRLLPKMKPGEQNGEKINIQFSFPLKISIE